MFKYNSQCHVRHRFTRRLWPPRRRWAHPLQQQLALQLARWQQQALWSRQQQHQQPVLQTQQPLRQALAKQVPPLQQPLRCCERTSRRQRWGGHGAVLAR